MCSLSNGSVSRADSLCKLCLYLLLSTVHVNSLPKSLWEYRLEDCYSHRLQFNYFSLPFSFCFRTWFCRHCTPYSSQCTPPVAPNWSEIRCLLHSLHDLTAPVLTFHMMCIERDFIKNFIRAIDWIFSLHTVCHQTFFHAKVAAHLNEWNGLTTCRENYHNILCALLALAAKAFIMHRMPYRVAILHNKRASFRCNHYSMHFCNANNGRSYQSFNSVKMLWF